MAIVAAFIAFLDFNKPSEKIEPILVRIEEQQKKYVKELQRIASYLEALKTIINSKDFLNRLPK
jgi:hypothetical protein